MDRSRQKSMRQRELTPSRNIDIDSGVLNRSSSAPCSPEKNAEREMKMKLMRAKSTVDMDTTTDYRVVAYRRGLAPRPPAGYRSKPSVAYTCIQPASSAKRTQRYVPKSPQRILDAPTIRDDFYLNVLDWGHCNIVAVALDNIVYLWNAESGDVEQLDEVEPPLFVSSLKWSVEGKYLSVALSDGTFRLYDPRQKKLLRTLIAQHQRIGAIAWRKNVVSYGSRTGGIYHHDVRVKDSLIGQFDSHNGEVCALKWSPDEQHLTSGGADRMVHVWDEKQLTDREAQTPIYAFSDHNSTVKAVEYVPFLSSHNCNVVATGGGGGDHCVKLWNLSSGTLHSSLDTGNKVSAILFNKHYREMCVAQAGPQNIVRFYDYSPANKFRLISDLEGHTGRVLALAQSPCNQYVMSASADESLRLWYCWKMEKQQNSSASLSKISNVQMNKLSIRSDSGFGGSIR